MNFFRLTKIDAPVNPALYSGATRLSLEVRLVGSVSVNVDSSISAPVMTCLLAPLAYSASAALQTCICRRKRS